MKLFNKIFSVKTRVLFILLSVLLLTIVHTSEAVKRSKEIDNEIEKESELKGTAKAISVEELNNYFNKLKHLIKQDGGKINDIEITYKSKHNKGLIANQNFKVIIFLFFRMVL